MSGYGGYGGYGRYGGASRGIGFGGGSGLGYGMGGSLAQRDPICPRCGEKTNCTMMSKFNTQEICMGCIDKEKKHPKYQEASDAEAAAVRRGDLNFPGIGKPADL